MIQRYLYAIRAPYLSPTLCLSRTRPRVPYRPAPTREPPAPYQPPHAAPEPNARLYLTMQWVPPQSRLTVLSKRRGRGRGWGGEAGELAAHAKAKGLELVWREVRCLDGLDRVSQAELREVDLVRVRVRVSVRVRVRARARARIRVRV